MTAVEKDHFLESDELAREESEKYFRRACDFRNHQNVLLSTELGRFLYEFKGSTKIDFDINCDLKPTQARFIQNETKGFYVIEHGISVNALIIGHELRHAWWVMVGDKGNLKPVSPEEYILRERFMEADARAIEVGLMSQIAYAYPYEDDYVQHLLASLEPLDLESFGYSYNRLCAVGRDPQMLKATMRAHFDKRIAVSPAEAFYEQKIFEKVDSLLSPPSSSGIRGLIRRMAATEVTLPSSGVIRPEFVNDLINRMGVYNDNGDNYLTQTKGPDFMNPCYTRVCNYRLEELASQVRPAPRGILAPVVSFLRHLGR